VARTRSRILAEQIEAQIKAQMLMMAQQGQLNNEALVDMLRDVRKGKSLDEVFYRYVVKPEKDAQEQMLTSGLDGSSLMPGAPPGGMPPGGAAPPTAPNPADVLAGLMGGGGEGPEPMSRLSIPMGGGSFAGSQMGG
jgi:hypothetical protein